MDQLEKSELKGVVRDAIKEWLDARFLDFGKWTFRSLMAAFFSAIVYFILWANGWGKHA